MPDKVKLSDIIDYMQMQNEEVSSYLNKETGELITLSNEVFEAAEEDQPLENFQDWQQEEIKTAAEIMETDKYVQLPSSFEIHEYKIMERFCFSIADQEVSERLCSAIRGSGAFRRFKDNILRLDLEDEWYKFRDEEYKEIAIDWCRENGVEFVDQ